jgi:hypothetical protein
VAKYGLQCGCTHFFNPQQSTANVTVKLYFDNKEPTEHHITATAGVIVSLDLNESMGILAGNPFRIVAESDLPVLPQAIHFDYSPWNEVPDAISTVPPYPGRLTDGDSR